MTLFLVSLFGSVGCLVRYLGEYLVRRHHPISRPWATVTANAIGCGIAGFIAYHFTGSLDAHLRDIVITGFCGGLTTFSSAFAIPAILQREHHWGYSATLITTTPLLCFGLFAAGTSLGH
ncbi:MAG: fluoride efflux transporter FluC [Acidimicrobiales bacterium]